MNLKQMGFRDEARYLKSEEYHIMHKLVDQQATWRNVDIPKTTEECSGKLKFLIRKGIPDGYRPGVQAPLT